MPDPQVRPEEIERIENADTFEELKDIAFQIIDRMDQPVSMVCGPITTGGAGDIESNLRLFRSVIDELRVLGLSVFSQMPFESAMARIKETDYYQGENHLLETFYFPLFVSGKIKRLYFLPDWKSSNGATWEHGQAERLGIEIVYL